jgi:hypothetical protein
MGLAVFKMEFNRGEAESWLGTMEGVVSKQVLERDDESETYEVKVMGSQADDFEAQAEDAINFGHEGLLDCMRVYEV